MKKLLLIAMVLAGSWLNAQITVSFSAATASCNNDGSVTANVSGGTAPYTYAWYHYLDMNTTVGTAATLSNVAGGYYVLVVTDANNVTNQQNWVTIPSVLSAYPSNVTNANCPASDGSVTYTVNGGAAPYTYNWSNGQSFGGQMSNTSTITNLPAGQYSITVTDANGCTVSPSDSLAEVYSIAPFTLTTSNTPANCNDGTATVNVSGGTAPYTYYWQTTPPQTTTTASGLNGQTWNSVTVTDANGCSGSAWGYVPYGPGALQVTGSATSAMCPNNNGTINISVSSGSAPYTYVWSNGATTQDLSGLASGQYTLTVTDNAGCYITVTKYVGSSSPVYATVSTTPTNCSNNSGTATVSASGGTAPYTYLWGNGQTTATATGLGAGYYGATVTDANGCVDYSSWNYVSIPASCYSGVTGYVYNDMDGNCTLNGIETGLPGQVIYLGGNQYASTDYMGRFQASFLTAGTYTVSHQATNPNWNTLCPVADYTVTTTTGNYVSGNDFYDVPVSLQNDMQVFVSAGTARPGFTHNKYYSIHNAGTTTMSGTIEVVHDANEVFLGGPGVTAYNAVTRTITIPYNTLGAYGYLSGHLNFSLPVSVPLGTVLSTTAHVDPVAGDLTPADNDYTSSNIVVGSYDPNMKEVSPAGAGVSGLISANNHHLDYTVHFQNTGTYLAETVVIVDTLDADLDIMSFQLVGASHDVSWEISGPRIVKFTFNNIMLPDSNSNEAASHGLVSYRINQLPGLAGGTEIENTAYIYFDYNAPIITNTTLNTIEIVGVKENAFTSGVTISPNPAQDKITISNKTKELCQKIEIMDINGRVVTSIIPAGATIQLPDMASGVYIINAHYNSGIYKEKLVISK